MIGETIRLLGGIALAIVATTILFVIVSWIKTRREQRATESRGTEYQKTGQTGSGYKKKTRRLGWLVTILVLALLGFVGWKFLLPKIAEGDKPDYTLSCGTDGYIKLPMKRVIMVEVMPSADTAALDDTTDYVVEPDEEDYYAEEEGDRWTMWLVRPPGSLAFWYDISDEIEYQESYGDEVGEPGDLNPLQREYVKKYITGVRFRNTGEKPVVVRLHLSGSF